MTATPTGPRGRASARTWTLGLATMVALVSVAVALPSFGGAKSAHVIGRTKQTPAPLCPGADCRVEGRVTAFQQVADGVHKVMQAPRDGKLVAWAVKLGRPNKTEKNYFGALFKSKNLGTDAYARVDVLRKIGGDTYRLMRQSPPVKVQPF